MPGGATKRPIRVVLVTISALLVGLLAPGPAQGARSKGSVPLYRLSAQGAWLRGASGGGLRLVLKHPAPNVEVVRSSGRRTQALPLKSAPEFAASWSRYGYKRNAPVAAIRDLGAPRDRDTLLVRLSHPRILSGGGISYLATRVRASDAPKSLAGVTAQADDRISPQLGGANVLVSAGQPTTIFAQINYTLPIAWSSIFVDLNGSARVYGLNPFTGGPISFGQNTRALLFPQFFMASLKDDNNTGYLNFISMSEGRCLQLVLNTPPPTSTSLQLQIGSAFNQINGPFANLQQGVTELCL